MIITLDDVACLLYLLIMGDLWDVPPSINEEGVSPHVVELIEITVKENTLEPNTCKVPKYRLEWFDSLFECHRGLN